MEDIQESFTRRILRRVSQRRERDKAEAMNRGSELSQRRSKILKAIKDSSAPYGSSISVDNDGEYHEGSNNSFRDSFNLTGLARNDDNNNDEKPFKVNANFPGTFCSTIDTFSSFNNANEEDETPILLKVTEGHIEIPAKMIAELKNIESKIPSDAIFDFDETHVTQSSISDLSTSTEDQTKKPDGRTSAFTTEAVIEMCQRVSSILTDIQCDYDDLQNFHDNKFSTITSVRSTEENDSRSATFVKETYDRPIMTSTQKSAITASTHANIISKNTNRETTAGETYDEEKFLDGALGDERYDAMLSRKDSTRISNFINSDSMSESLSPLQMRVMQALNLPKIETPSRNFGTLDRSMRIYRSVSQRIKKKFRPGVQMKSEENDEVPIIPSRFDEVDRIQELLQEVKIQQTLMNQATKALDLCNNIKEFTESSERVESERILLLASLRGKAALEEIKWITSEDNIEDGKIFSERGEVTISEISLDLRECLQGEIQQEEFNEYFVVVVTQGLKVWSTRPISSGVREKRVKFPGTVSIANLTPGFKIRIEVYSLKLRRHTYSDEEKYRIGKKRNSRDISRPSYKNIFVSPTRFFKKVENSSPSCAHRCNSVLKATNTSFALCGYTELILHDLSVSSPWPLMLVPSNSNLRGTIDLNLACRLHFSVSHEGFLNHGDESGGLATWNRRWCVLRGHTLKFWNYPREQETKEPLKIIELINCVSNEVTIVDRSICAKKRTLLIETKRAKFPTDRNSILVECKPTCTIVRNLLSYDTPHELIEWSRKLNEVIVALEEWNVIGPRSHPPEVSNL